MKHSAVKRILSALLALNWAAAAFPAFPVHAAETVYSSDFEDGDISAWTNRGSSDTTILSVSEANAVSGSKSLCASNRSKSWMGAAFRLDDKLEAGTYLINVQAMQESSDNINFSLQYTDTNGENHYIALGSDSGAGWHKFSDIEVSFTEEMTEVYVYFDGGLDNIYIDDFSIKSTRAASGTCGENLTWVLDAKGTLTISGTGAMATWTSETNVPWYDNRGTIQKVVIENGVTSIGECAFFGCTKLTSVTIPNSVSNIEAMTFYNCTALTSVTIPDSVSSIGLYAFYDTLWLKLKRKENPLVIVNHILIDGNTCTGDVIIPDGTVTSIGTAAFENCKMTSVKIPNSVTSIESYAFQNCKTLTSVTIPDSVSSIGSFAFCSCNNLVSVTISDGVTTVGYSAFQYCNSLTSIVIPDSVSNIKSYAFEYCKNLTSVTIKNPNCEIKDDKYTISDTATIYGYSNSTAQAYAEKYNRKFVALDSEPEEPTTEAPTQPTTEKPTEPATEAPTQPTTEKPTEPVNPSRDKKFVEGGDNWSFSNSRTNFGDTYFMQDSYYKKLLNGLNYIEKEKIYDAVRNTRWGGSCYGMATTSVLASNSILNPADYQENANFLHDISAPPSDDVKSLINYYFMLQFTDNIQNQTRQAAYETEEAKLKKLISCLKDDSPALLTYFGYFNGSKFNYGGHGVVAYSVKYGTYSQDGKAYNGKILTYDNNAVDYDDSYCLYFNTSDWSWVIPHYQLDSSKGSTLGFISDDVNLLNAHGYLNGGTYQNSDSNYIAMLDADTMNENYSLYKVRYSNGAWINAPTAEDDIKLFSSLTDMQETNNLCFALKDAGSGYVMELNSPTSMNLSMNYENTLLNATASKGLNMCFSPDGCIFLEGENTNYNMQIVLNESELVTDWYHFSVAGGKTDSIKLEKTKGGYILASSDMKNVIAEAYNDDDDAFVNFSTDAESVYLYEIDKNTIGVKVDSNGDGTYDKLIAQTAEAKNGDANLDGTVDILDVITINKAVLGKETLTRHQNEFSDVNQNGVPDSSDSLAVLKYIVGLTATL